MDLVSSYISFTSKTSGRDKIFRLIQYTSKLVGHSLRHNLDTDVLKRMKQMEGVLSSSRRTFRLAKTIDNIHGSLQSLSIPEIELKTMVISSKLSYAVFFYYDLMLWGIKSGVFKGDMKYYSNSTTKYWFWALSFLILRDFYEIRRLQIKKKSLIEICQENPEIVVDLSKNIADLLVCLVQLKKLDYSEGFIGFFGIISSVMGIVQMLYPKLKLTPS